jgi:hypothetical protein
MTQEPPKLALIDADFLVYRIGFADRDASEAIAKSRLTQLLFDIVYEKLKADDYKAWITGKGNYRFELAKTQPYKGNRKDMEKPPHYEALREHLLRLGAVMTDGDEADDAVAEASVEGGWIVHVDKDLNQLQGWHYNPVKDEKYYVTEEDGHRSFYTQLLTGDRIDNILGLDGIGPKKAEKILKDCKTELEMYEAVKAVYEKKGVSHERLLESGNLLWLRRKKGQLYNSPQTSLQPSN